MAKVEPLWWNWKRIQEMAHAYGAGPVTVYAPDEGFELPDNWFPDLKGKDRRDYEEFLRQRSRVGAARAVQMWNKATGVAVFQLVDTPEAADIVIKIGETQRMGVGQAAGEGGPDWLPGEQASGDVTLHPAVGAEPSLVAHELGHTIGLAHPDTAATRASQARFSEYADMKQLMSSGVRPSPVEARTVRDLYGSNITPQIERQEAPRRRAAAEAEKKRKAKPANPGGPGSGQQR